MHSLWKTKKRILKQNVLNLIETSKRLEQRIKVTLRHFSIFPFYFSQNQLRKKQNNSHTELSLIIATVEAFETTP